MIRSTYISRATGSLSDDDLFELLSQCRRNNVQKSLTGMLLFGSGTFLQCLEGEPADVDELLETIAADPRHTAIKVLRRDLITSRQFCDWSMGFEQVTDGTLSDIPGLRHLGIGSFNPEYLEGNPEMVDTLLRWASRSNGF